MMSNFSLGSLVDWKEIGLGELIDFEMPSAGFRAVDFDIMASDRVEIHAVGTGEDAWLVGVGDGIINVRFTTAARVAVVIMADPSSPVRVWMRTKLQTQVVPESLDDTFTTIEPRGSSSDLEFKRLQRMMELNQLRREQALREEFNQRLAARDALVEPDDPAPAPAPVAAPKAKRAPKAASPAPAPVEEGGDDE